jgi:hypothetical protein
MAPKGKKSVSDEQVLAAAQGFAEQFPDRIGEQIGDQVCLWFAIRLADPNPVPMETLMQEFLAPCFGYASLATVRQLEEANFSKAGFGSSTSEKS